MILRAYFDESGIHHDSKVTGVAGFVGSEKEWVRFTSEWERELARFRRDTGQHNLYFHATECEGGKGPWFGVPRPIREAYNARLARVVANYAIKGISVAVEIDQWNRHASAEFKSRYLSPYGLCVEYCLQHVASFSLNNARGTPVALVFAEQKEYTNRLKEIYFCYSKGRPLANIKAVSFASPYDCTPLQGADMLSYESYRYWAKIESSGLEFGSSRDAFNILADAGHFEWAACYGSTGIINAVKKYHISCGLPDPYA